MKHWLLVLLCMISLEPAARAGEGLVYSISEGESRPSPYLTKTEIVSINPNSGRERVVFSDAGAEVMVLPSSPGSGQGPVIAVGGGKLIARGFERKGYTGGWPTFPAAVYELSTDGSGRTRKIFDIEGENGSSNFRNLILSPSGSLIGYINYIGGKPILSVRESAAGNLLKKVDLSPILLDGFIREIGWMPDGRTLFFTVETGDSDSTSKASNERVGSYLMKDDGSPPVRIAPTIANHPDREGYRGDPDLPPVLLGWMPDQQYLFRVDQWKIASKGGSPKRPETFLYSVDPATKTLNDFPVNLEGEVASFRLAQSGQWIAFSKLQRKNDAVEIWIADLESGSLKKIFSLPTKIPALPWVNLVGWVQEN